MEKKDQKLLFTRIKILKYVNCSYHDGTFLFTYLLDNQKVILELSHTVKSSLPPQTIERIGFNIGMCYLMDLAEITLPKSIMIYKKMPPLALNYWITLYEEQILEKCYALGLPTTVKNVIWKMEEEKIDMTPLTIPGKKDHVAICLTGGKESLSLLKTLEGKKPLLLFFLDLEANVHRQKVYQKVKDMHLTVSTISNRKILFGPLEKKYGGLQCGVDIAHLVFNTMLYADIGNYVLIGNEYSANYPNDVYEGNVINHQFVKTIHFAENLNNYIHDFVSKDFAYYSPFFGLYEYKITDLLFQNEKYLDVWTSCNRILRDINFCCNCYKCAFTYLLARTKKPEAFLSKIFSKNMLDEVELFKPLMDFVGIKPLDCVGDKAEVWIALELLLEKGENNKVLTYYKENIRPQIIENLEMYKQQVNSIQKVPVVCPEEIQTIINKSLGLK